MQTICILLGVPEADRHWLFEAVEPGFDFRGSRKASRRATRPRTPGRGCTRYGQELIAAKRAEPDRRHALGRRARDARRRRPAPAHRRRAVHVLHPAVQRRRGDHPQRRRRRAARPRRAPRPARRCCAADPSLLPTAVEEMVRWTTPSPSKRRTATATTRAAADARSRPGEKVVVWEGSANRDELAFDDPDDASTSPGSPTRTSVSATGIHYCLGANLARLEMRVLFEELLDRFRRDPGGQAGGVDAEQPAHRHPPSHRRTGSVKPDAFAAVMATGIVSIAAADHGYHVISDGAGCRRGGLVGGLGGCGDGEVAARLRRSRRAVAAVHICRGVRSRGHAAAVGRPSRTRLSGSLLRWHGCGLAMLTARLLLRQRWIGLRDRARGGWELASVATSGLAILAADSGYLLVGGRATGFGGMRVRLDDWIGRLARVPRPIGAGVDAAGYLDSDGRCRDRNAGR